LETWQLMIWAQHDLGWADLRHTTAIRTDIRASTDITSATAPLRLTFEKEAVAVGVWEGSVSGKCLATCSRRCRRLRRGRSAYDAACCNRSNAALPSGVASTSSTQLIRTVPVIGRPSFRMIRIYVRSCRSSVTTCPGMFGVPLRGVAPVQAAPTTPSPEPENSGRLLNPLLAATGKLLRTPTTVGGGSWAPALGSALIPRAPASMATATARMMRHDDSLKDTFTPWPVDSRSDPSWFARALGGAKGRVAPVIGQGAVEADTARHVKHLTTACANDG
jgi:hypothetical protein